MVEMVTDAVVAEELEVGNLKLALLASAALLNVMVVE
jgi:hypothetical protein